MLNVKEITVYAIGDSASIKTWSNVPYFFTKNLETKGIKVNRVNLQENSTCSAVYKYSIYLLIKLFYPKSTHSYFRSGLNNYLTNQKIKKALRDYPFAQLQLFLSYSFSSKPFSRKTVAHFSDWSYWYLIEQLQRRKAYWFEKTALKREINHITQSDCVLSLFPKSAEYIRQLIPNKTVQYLGNVVNSEKQFSSELIIHEKLKSKALLFIGGKKYAESAREILEAFELLENKNTASLHFVGLTANDIGGASAKNVHFYGYLNKNEPQQGNLYYTLLQSARALVNTQKGWAAFSALTEAMHFYTPVICRPFEEFTETYGHSNDFGLYLQTHKKLELKQALEIILDMDDARMLELMKNANEKTKMFTWENYTQNFMNLINELPEPAKQ